MSRPRHEVLWATNGGMIDSGAEPPVAGSAAAERSGIFGNGGTKGVNA